VTAPGAEPAAAPAAGRARLGRYALWQLRDYVFERGLPLLIVAALVLLPMIQGRRRFAVSPEQEHGFALTMLAETFTGFFGFVIVLLSANGVVSNDRKQGYYRFLFAKPVSIPAYYAQSLAVNGVGALAVSLVVLGVFFHFVHAVFPLGVLAFVALYYVALGGIVFLVSSLTRHDWVAVGALWGLAQLLRGLYPADRSAFGRVVDVLLPPAHRVSAVGRALINGEHATGMHVGDHDFTVAVAWLLAWGVGAFVAGLVVLRRRSMA
jgi:hypothetical protein